MVLRIAPRWFRTLATGPVGRKDSRVCGECAASFCSADAHNVPFSNWSIVLLGRTLPTGNRVDHTPPRLEIPVGPATVRQSFQVYETRGGFREEAHPQVPCGRAKVMRCCQAHVFSRFV